MTPLGIYFIALGCALVADGVGSVLKQPTQSFFWWQFVRSARAIGGVSLIVIGAIATIII
jgi:hypothetical protein